MATTSKRRSLVWFYPLLAAILGALYSLAGCTSFTGSALDYEGTFDWSPATGIHSTIKTTAPRIDVVGDDGGSAATIPATVGSNTANESTLQQLTTAPTAK